MDPREEEAWFTGINTHHAGQCRGKTKVNFARGKHLVGGDAVSYLYVLHVRETLTFEEPARDLSRSLADAGRSQHAESCGLWGRLGLSRVRAQPDYADRS